MKKQKLLYYSLVLLMGIILLASCKGTPEVPTQFETLDVKATIFPDYTDIVIPANIAPLNFMVKDTLCTAVVAQFQGKGDNVVAGSYGTEGKVVIDSIAWRKLLTDNRGSEIEANVYVQHGVSWVKYNSHKLTVAQEDIDPYLSYRLIEPGFELYRQLGLYQRNLTNFNVHTIYENNRTYDEKNNHCINCHNYQNYSSKNFLFHVRANHGGTMIIENGKAKKVQLKDSTIITSGVYPSWHPRLNMIAFSTNKTGQTFHLYHKEMIEVIDEASDLLLYDVDKNEIRHILRTRGQLETFPCWTPDGKQLYYCSADISNGVDLNQTDSVLTAYIITHYDSIRYNLMKLDFDEKTLQFSEPQTVIDCAAMGKSVTVPRVSPDGKYLLYTLGDYGQFHIWHKSSDLWIKNLETGEEYPLTESNSPDIDSFHSWSSNGRWFVFSSRRDDGNYSRPYIAYFDKEGHSRKAFMLPQEDPEHSILLLKSYNVPELTKDAVEISSTDLRNCIYNTDGEKAKYVKN